MTCVVVGTVVDMQKGALHVRDAFTGEVHVLAPGNDETLELAIGTDGVFIGQMRNGKVTVVRHEIRRLLDPLYEEDLIGAAGQMVLELAGDPFPEIFAAQSEKLAQMMEEDAEPQPDAAGL